MIQTTILVHSLCTLTIQETRISCCSTPGYFYSKVLSNTSIAPNWVSMIQNRWITHRKIQNRDKKNSFLFDETRKLHADDGPAAAGCPVSNPDNNCANGLWTLDKTCTCIFFLSFFVDTIWLLGSDVLCFRNIQIALAPARMSTLTLVRKISDMHEVLCWDAWWSLSLPASTEDVASLKQVWRAGVALPIRWDAGLFFQFSRLPCFLRALEEHPELDRRAICLFWNGAWWNLRLAFHDSLPDFPAQGCARVPSSWKTDNHRRRYRFSVITFWCCWLRRWCVVIWQNEATL